MPRKDKLSEKEKSALEDALRGASVSDSEVYGLAEGVDESGKPILPTDTSEDLLSAAATALEFVEALESPPPRPGFMKDGEAVAGFDALLLKLEHLRADITSLQRGVVGVFAAQLLTFRGKVVDLKSAISEEMVERLRMKFFKSFIESTFVDIVDSEFAALEKDLVDKIVEQTQDRFKDFGSRVRESEMDLRSTIVEQQNVVRSFMESLEEETASQRAELVEKQVEITKLEASIRKLQGSIDDTATVDAATEEFNRKISDLGAQVTALKDELLKKEAVIDERMKETQAARAEAREVKLQLGESQSEVEVYKSEAEAAKKAPIKSVAEIEALESKIELIEKTLKEKREEADAGTTRVKDLERDLETALKDKRAAEATAKSHSDELKFISDKIKRVKDLEQSVYDFENELKESQEQVRIVEMQREAFEKATRLMEKERDIALEMRDLSDERTKRYIMVLGMEANTKVLLLVDEVGSVTFTELGKSLGVPVGLATKHARELEKLGVLKIKGEKAISTLKEIKFE